MNGRIGSLLRKLKDRPVYVVLIFIAIYALYSSACAVLRYYGFYCGAFDLGIYMQSLWTTLHGEGVFYTTLWEGSRFAAHFEPILVFVLPLYALIPRAETLLVLQSLVLALGALPVYWIARDELGKRAGIVFAGLYLLYPALHGINQDEFHGSALAIPFLLFCFYMFKRRRYIWGMLFAILAMMCKENVALVVAFMGLYWLWEERREIASCLKKRLLPRQPGIIFPAFLTLVGLVWLSLAVFVVIPHFNPEGEHLLVSRYFEDPLGNLFADPGVKIGYLLCLLAPLLFTPLLHLPTLLIGFPIMVQNLFTDDLGMYHIWTQHSALLIPWFFIASIYGIRRLPALKNRLLKSVFLQRLPPGRLFPAMIGISLVMTVGMSFVFGPLAGRGLSPKEMTVDLPELAAHHRALQQAKELIDGPVYAQDSLFPFVCHRVDAYSASSAMADFFDGYRLMSSGGLMLWSDEVTERGFDYILMDEKTHASIAGYPPIRKYMMEAISEESIQRLENEYGLYAQGDGISLYRKGYNLDGTEEVINLLR